MEETPGAAADSDGDSQATQIDDPERPPAPSLRGGRACQWAAADDALLLQRGPAAGAQQLARCLGPPSPPRWAARKRRAAPASRSLAVVSVMGPGAGAGPLLSRLMQLGWSAP